MNLFELPEKSKIDQIADFCKDTGNFFKVFGEILYGLIYYVTHPLEAFSKLWHFLVTISLPVSTVAVVVLIVYVSVTDSPKLKRWIGYILITFVLLHAINAML